MDPWPEFHFFVLCCRRLQVEKRALEVWGSEEVLEAEHEKRDSKRDEVNPQILYYGGIGQ